MFSNQDWNAATSHSTLPMLISLWTIFYILCEWRDKYICVYTRCGDIFIYCIRWCWYEQKKMCTQHHSYRKIIRKERDKTDVPSPIGRECFPSDCFFFLPQKTPMQSDIPIAAALYRPSTEKPKPTCPFRLLISCQNGMATNR